MRGKLFVMDAESDERFTAVGFEARVIWPVAGL